MTTISGFGVGSKSSTGTALILNNKEGSEFQIEVAARQPAESAELELAKFLTARNQVVDKFRSARTAATDETLAEILSAQLALLEDDELVELVKEELNSGENAIGATQNSVNGFIELLGDATGEFKERIADLTEIKVRIINAILGVDDSVSIPTTGAWIIVAEDLTPLETSKFTDSVVGVITRKGGPTSHTAIVCRQLGIPALVGCQDISAIRNGLTITINPVAALVEIGGEVTDASSGNWWQLMPEAETPIFKLYANVGSISDAKNARAAGAQGIGLFRSELALLHLTKRPAVSEQMEIYRSILDEVPKGEVIFRTLDAGTDKPIPFLNLDTEENPALGLRGQRIERIDPDFFQEQLIALRDAASKVADIKVSVMAPMISTRDEAITFAEQARSVGFDSVGVMVEVPALIDYLPELVGTLDFISIGTNDLSQYLFAADRQNSLVAELLDPWQPGLLRTLSRIAANSSNMKIGLCGEAASDPLLAPVLVGLGIHSLSAGVGALGDLAAVAKRLTEVQAQRAAEIALASPDRKSARRNVLDFLSKQGR